MLLNRAGSGQSGDTAGSLVPTEGGVVGGGLAVSQEPVPLDRSAIGGRAALRFAKGAQLRALECELVCLFQINCGAPLWPCGSFVYPALFLKNRVTANFNR